MKKKRINLKLLQPALCVIFGAAIIMLGLLSAYVPLAGAVDIRVPGDYSSIQAAIGAANDGDVIIAGAKTYNETINFLGKAITVKSTDPNNPAVVAATIIDGDKAGSAVTFNHGEGSGCVLSGVTVQGGSASYGGGISCTSSSPVITHCAVSGNLASYGGGIYCTSSSPIITHCTVSGNSAPRGGGIYGDSSSLPTFTECAVSGNSASSYGGGIYCASSLAITHCTISANSVTSSSGGGGGIYCTSFSSVITEPAIKNCIVSKNSARNGGGMYCYSSSPRVTNCLMARNVAAGSGGGVYSTSSSPVMTNCTLAGNSASSSKGGGAYVYSGSLTITNCILWSDSSGEISGNSSATVTYCDIRGGYDGTGDISDTPLFVKPDEGNYRLGSDSPCIDAGTGSNAPDTDIDGKPRPMGTGYDMGAYEYDGPLLHEPSEVHVYSGQSIQAAISTAWKGDVIIVHEGTYHGRINFAGKAVTIKSTAPDDPAVVAATVIDGGSAGSVVVFSSGEKSDSVLSGFTIKNGKAVSGGGIYCANISSPTISNCTITGNTATSYGGGIYCYSSASPDISNCNLRGNSAPEGGGMYYDSSSLPTITKCAVSGNSASSGGGIYCTSSSPAITHCTVSGNSASSNGGGIYCAYSSSSPVITHCMVSGNLAGNGGGIFCSSSSSPKVTNCLINRNISSDTGGGICSDSSSPVMINCTLAGNSASPSNGGGAYVYSGSPIITNCILWSDSPGEISGNGSAAITCCDIRGGYTGSGNISDSPSFVNPDAGNYRLRGDSPCIDKGGSNAPATDLDGNPRPIGAGYDMGAYELFDVIPPQPRCKDITVQIDAEGQATITADQIDNGSSDNQGIESLAVSPCTFTCADTGSNPVTLTVTDLSGNTDTCLASVRVEDNANPIARCKDITVQLDAEGQATITADQIDNGSSDNCSIASMTVSPSSFSRTDVGNNNVVLTLTDASGNTAHCSATVEVKEVPVLIELEQFTAAAASQGNRIILTWTTLSEIDNAGFNLWRSEAEEGEYIRINPRIIAAEGGSTLGAEYAYTDYTAQPATVYFYRLENIDTSGARTFHGPVSAAIPEN